MPQSRTEQPIRIIKNPASVITGIFYFDFTAPLTGIVPNNGNYTKKIVPNNGNYTKKLANPVITKARQNNQNFK